jgi:hypothetical protein
MAAERETTEMEITKIAADATAKITEKRVQLEESEKESDDD